jgi:hypothetical protein
MMTKINKKDEPKWTADEMNRQVRLKAGQGRFIPYSICRRCGSMPGWEGRVDARLLAIFRRGGARREP